MTETLSLSRQAFKRGVDEALTFKPLRRILSGYLNGAQANGHTGADTTGADNSPAGEARVVTVAKSRRKTWHVKRSS